MVPEQSMKLIKNAYLYLSEICNNPHIATASALAIQENTVTNVLRQGATSSDPVEKRGRKAAGIDEFDKSAIRLIVHEYFRRGESPTIDKLLKTVKERLETGFDYGEWVLRRVLHEIGFKYGRRTTKNLHLMYERADIVDWRRKYLREIRQYRQEQRPLIYLDETWFNVNEAPSRVWCDTAAETNPDRTRKEGLTLGLRVGSGKGKRLIIVNAIQQSGPVPQALWVYRSGKQTSPEDYHEEMDAHNFEKWFATKLLPNLPPKSVIIMDNASYHSRRKVSLPTRGTRDEVKQQLQDMDFFTFAKNKGRPMYYDVMTMSDIFQFLREFRPFFDKYAVDAMAAERNHTVLRLPPYHCIFNPIEMLWGYQKQELRKERSYRTIDEAQAACERHFAQIPTADLNGYFDHVKDLEQEYMRQEGIGVELHPPVVIPVYDDEDDPDDEQPDFIDDLLL